MVQRKNLHVTGSAATIKNEKIATRQTSNVTNALAGQVAGVQTTSNNGQPGKDAEVRIRGIGSISASNKPLYVVDGVPYDGEISAISTSDIESMTVLKDAASNALYGARGANGVILITTKRIGFDPEADAEENEGNMKDIIECVKTGEVTYAVRDTSINGITIKVDDIMGIDDDGIKKVGQDVEKVTLELLEEMVDEDSELISIYYGEDTTKEQAEALLEKVEETYGDCDVQLEYGGQPIYYFLLSVE